MPRSTVAKLLKDVTPGELKCSTEAQALLGECLDEFVQMLTAEANEASASEKKKTLSEAHVLAALHKLGFGRFAAACEGLADPKAARRAEAKAKHKAHQSELSTDELLRIQQDLFASARQSMETKQTSVAGPS